MAMVDPMHIVEPMRMVDLMPMVDPIHKVAGGCVSDVDVLLRQGSDKIVNFTQNSTFKANKDKVRDNLNHPRTSWSGETFVGKTPKGKDAKSRSAASVQLNETKNEGRNRGKTRRAKARQAGSPGTTAQPHRGLRLGRRPQPRAHPKAHPTWRPRTPCPLRLPVSIPDSLRTSMREVGGKAKATSPLSNMAKNAKTSAMEVDGATGGADESAPPATASTSNSGGARAKDNTGRAGAGQCPPGNGGGPNRGNGDGQNRGGGSNQNQGDGGKRQRKPKPKLKPGDPGWEEFRQKQNKRSSSACRKRTGREARTLSTSSPQG